MPKISIITVNFNNADGLQQTISSVAGQSLLNFEYIVVDGNSTDSSVAVIKKHEEVISDWISKTDSGVYQAMNRGIRMASGTYVLFLNSGDTFCSNTVLEEVSNKINGEKDIYYGNLMFKTKRNSFVQEYPKEFSFNYFLERSLPHPGSFIKKDMFERIFYYSEDYKIVSDWEFFICVICKHSASYEHLNLIISNFELQGMSNDPKNKGLIEQERLMVLRSHFPSLYDDALAQMENRKILDHKERQTNSKSRSSKKQKKIMDKFIKKLHQLFRTKTKDLS